MKGKKMSIAPLSISSVNKSLNINFKGYQAANHPVFQDKNDSFEYTAADAEKQNAVKKALMAAVLAVSMVMGQTQPQKAQAAASVSSLLEEAMEVKENAYSAEAAADKKRFPLMSETNKKVLSAKELKELAGSGSLNKVQVIENLKNMKHSLTEEVLAKMCKNAGIKKMPNPDECKVTPSCSDCGRGWGKCNYSSGSSLNKDMGTWQNRGTKTNNTKIYLLRMPGPYSNEQARYTKDGSSVILGGKQIIEFCNTSENQIKLGTIYNLQEALKSLGIRK